MNGSEYSYWMRNNPKMSKKELGYRLGCIQNMFCQLFKERRNYLTIALRELNQII